MSPAELGKKLNAVTTRNVLRVLENVPTQNNLFVPSQELSALLNYLTPFLALKKAGNFDKVFWLDALAGSEDIHSIVETYSLIILIRAHEADLQLLTTLFQRIKNHTQVTIVVKDLSRSFYYELSKRVFHLETQLPDHYALADENLLVLNVTNYCQVMKWKTFPTCIEDFVFSVDMDLGGLLLYLRNPLSQVSKLGEAIADIMAYTTSQSDIFKVKNAFAKGDHSSLLLNNLLDDKIPAMLLELLNPSELDFYQNKLRGNLDLVVLERNLDYLPLLLSQTNYMGFLDDMIGTKDEYNSELANNVKVSDEIYEQLKHINVSTIELVLRDYAKGLIAEEKQLKEKHYGQTQASELKAYASEAKKLASKKEEVEKHLVLIRDSMAKLDSNITGHERYDIHKEWLSLQNDLFDNDYKNRVASMFKIINEYTSFEIVATLVSLVSLTSDGIYQSDYEKIEREVALNFGLAAALALRNLNEFKLIRVTENNSFLGNFTFSRTETTTTTTAGATRTTAAPGEVSDEKAYDDPPLLGLTGGQDVYKSTYTLISKFWNLHPFEENQVVAKTIEDYTVPNFALASNTVPLTNRIVESLYFRDFLTYTPINNVYRRPNWEKLNLDTMLKGQTIDKNVSDELDNRKALPTPEFKKEYLIVVIMGGITRSEISIFRHLQTRLPNKTLLVVTSGLVNNKKLLNAMQES